MKKQTYLGVVVAALVIGGLSAPGAQAADADTSLVSRDCDPNYDGCVPIASDVDCSTGSGNGPAYVVGPVRVVGIDVYGLDRDGDGIGCVQG